MVNLLFPDFPAENNLVNEDVVESAACQSEIAFEKNTVESTACRSEIAIENHTDEGIAFYALFKQIFNAGKHV